MASLGPYNTTAHR